MANPMEDPTTDNGWEGVVLRVQDLPEDQVAEIGAADCASDEVPSNTILGAIADIVHCRQCTGVDCQVERCSRTKRGLEHLKYCRLRIIGTCPVCKQFVGLFCYHAKSCTLDGCEVPFCGSIRQKIAMHQQAAEAGAATAGAPTAAAQTSAGLTAAASMAMRRQSSPTPGDVFTNEEMAKWRMKVLRVHVGGPLPTRKNKTPTTSTGTDTHQSVQELPKDQVVASYFKLVQHILAEIVHCRQCTDADCQVRGCARMKRLLEHMKECRKWLLGTCFLCNHFTNLFCSHAKSCTLDGCMVPFCGYFRQKFTEQQQAAEAGATTAGALTAAAPTAASPLAMRRQSSLLPGVAFTDEEMIKWGMELSQAHVEQPLPTEKNEGPSTSTGTDT